MAAIGIDLGTTNSCVSYVQGDQVEVIANREGSRTTPSVVCITKDGERLVGEPAKRRQAVDTDRTIVSVKRQMGTGWRKTIGGKAYSPQEISAMILRKLREDTETFLGEAVNDAVITVPAYFDDAQRQATKDAGAIAGLNVLRIINEPTAAALAYGLNNGTAQKVMVYDLGGGTFDVSIIEIGDDVVEVLATTGDNQLGGDDFDECLAAYIASRITKIARFDASADPQSKQRIREAAEIAKKELSLMESTSVNLPFIGYRNGEPFHFEETITRTQFNDLTRDLVERTGDATRRALADAGIAASELDQVLLVGGSTRIPAVQEFVRSLTGVNPSCAVNPDECVSQGAAIQAATLTKGGGLAKRGGELLLLDVVPMSFSIETVGGVATRVIERNSTLPIHYEQIFTTAAPFQTKVEVRVLQGERPLAADNKCIGKFQLKGIKRAPAGVPQINVSFDIDANGILTVSARDLGTGNIQSISITESDRLSREEIEAAIKDAERYAAQDASYRESLELRNKAQELVNRAETTLNEQGKSIQKEQKKRIKSALSSVRKLLSNKPGENPESDSMALNQAMAELEEALENLN